MNEMDLQKLRQQAFRIREHILAMGASAAGAHVGGSLSAADLLTVLYFHVLNVRPEEPRWSERDYFVLSKGHASAGLYATLAERGYFPAEELATYAQEGSRLAGHPKKTLPGVEFPTGSLGHGLSLGVGLALAAQRDGRANRAFVLMGDGELQEGSVWEAAMAASHHRLDNLIAIVDRNRLQITGSTERQMSLEPLADRWRAFGWQVAEVDGHDMEALTAFFAGVPLKKGAPTVLIAQTQKGRGVKFMEGRKKSHYVNLTPNLHSRALADLQAGKEEGQ